MPGIHPSSPQQVRWAFAAEARGKFPAGMAREWAHRYKCWTWDSNSRGGPLPKDCVDAVKILSKIRAKHPSWKVPAGVTHPAPALHLVPKPLTKKPRPGVVVFPFRAPAMPQAARTTRYAKPAKKKTGLSRQTRPARGGRRDHITAEYLINEAFRKTL